MRLKNLVLLGVVLASLAIAKHQPIVAQQDVVCPTDTFLDLTNAEGAGAGYARPSLKVNCQDGYLIVESNNITPYTFVPITPNPLRETQIVYQITLSPEYSETTTPISIFGQVAVAINGLAIYGPNEGAIPEAEIYGDPVYNGIMDACLGHTAQDYYHYHAMLQACFYEAIQDGEVSPILGYAFDGYPIYGGYGCVDEVCSDVILFESSYEQIGDPTTYAYDAYQYVKKDGAQYLDECNGRIQPDGTYGYHITETFPYILGCYHGIVDATVNGRDQSDPMGWAEFKAGGYQGMGGGQPPQGGQGGQSGQPPQGGQGGQPPQGGPGQPPPPPGGGTPPPPPGG
jgi:hypothetical protein